MWRKVLTDSTSKVMGNKSLMIFIGIVVALGLYNWLIA